METVYIVMAAHDYEGSSPIRAFTNQADADAFAASCIAYSETVPHCPLSDDDEALWDAYWAADEAYRKGHPAGDEYSADRFYVSELPVGLPVSADAVDPVNRVSNG